MRNYGKREMYVICYLVEPLWQFQFFTSLFCSLYTSCELITFSATLFLVCPLFPQATLINVGVSLIVSCLLGLFFCCPNALSSWRFVAFTSSDGCFLFFVACLSLMFRLLVFAVLFFPHPSLFDAGVFIIFRLMSFRLIF